MTIKLGIPIDDTEADQHLHADRHAKVIAKTARQQQVLSIMIHEIVGRDVMVEQAAAERGTQALRVNNKAGMFQQTFFELEKLSSQVAVSQPANR